MAVAADAPAPAAVGPGAAARAPDRLAWALVTLAVVATAFNDLAPILPVGELANDAFIYAFPPVVLYLLLRPGRLALPVGFTLLALALLATLVAGVAANYADVASAYFKGRSGIGRVATQGMAVAFGLLVALAFYNLARQGLTPAIARGARIAVLVMAGFGALEIASWQGVPGLTQLHAALSTVIHAGNGVDYPQRLRMTAFEVSWAAVMLTFLFPFALLDLPPRGWRAPAFVALVLGLALLTQSRTALLVIGGQALLLAWVTLRRRLDLMVHALALGACCAALLLLAPGVRQEMGEAAGNLVRYGNLGGPTVDQREGNVSNVTRLAAIRAGLSMFRERPLLGVGLGQYGFNYPGHLQAEDYRSWEVRKYVADAEEDWPPTYSIHVRLLAETGAIGYGIWLALLAPLLWRALRRADLATPEGRAQLAVAMTLAGWLLLGASIDSFRFFGGWIAVGVALALPRAAPRPAP